MTRLAVALIRAYLWTAARLVGPGRDLLPPRLSRWYLDEVVDVQLRAMGRAW